MKYDDILVHIGEFGGYQKRVYFILALPAMLCGAQVMSVVFTMAIPNYRCALPGYPGDTYDIQSPLHRFLVNLTIPPGDEDSYGPYEGCNIYSDVNVTAAMSQYDNNTVPYVTSANRSTIGCNSWVYDQSEFKDTIMTEFDANCDDSIFRSHGNMAASVGSMVGAVVIGLFADVFGRKKAIMLSLFIYFVCTLALYLAPDLYSIIVIKGILGIATQTTFSVAITAGLELVGPNKRSFAGMMIEFYWTIGVLACLPIAYFIKEWRNTQLVLCLLCVPLFSMWWLIPESPRWLLDKKRYAEVEKVLERVCQSNKTKLPPGAVDDSTAEVDDTEEVKICEIFSHRVLVFRICLIFFNWLAVSLLYYGLSLNVGNLDGSTYLNYLWGTLVEGLAYVIVFLLMDHMGRRLLYCACMLIGGVACVAVMFPAEYGDESDEWVTTALAMVGKMGVSGAYAIIYIMSAELIPTVVRNSAMGCCAVFENLGAVIAPYIADLGVITNGRQELPLVVFGAVSIVSGGLSMLLPETLHKKMPETLQDALNFNTTDKSTAYAVNQDMTEDTTGKSTFRQLEDSTVISMNGKDTKHVPKQPDTRF